jgi:hypothetical protein
MITVPSKIIGKKTYKKIVDVLKVFDEKSRIRFASVRQRHGSGSVTKCQGSATGLETKFGNST